MVIALALILSSMALTAALVAGPAPRLVPDKAMPVFQAMVKAWLVFVALSGLIAFAEGMRARDAKTLALQREARLRLAGSPNNPEQWKRQLAESEAAYATLQRQPPNRAVVWDVSIRFGSVGLVLVSLGGAVVLFRKRLDP